MILSFIKLFIIFLGLFVIFPSSVYASSINLSNGSSNTISDYNQEFQIGVDLSINSSDGTTYYLRGVFYQSGSTNYCGFTWNGNSWFSGPYSSGDGWKNFLAVTISSSSASTTLKAKLDPDDSGCKNSGTYNFKVERFTQSGSATFDSQNEQTLSVTLPTPTSTPAPTSAPSATNQPSNTPKAPSATKTSTTNSIVSLTSSKLPTSPKTVTSSLDNPAVLGEESVSRSATLTGDPNPSPTIIVEGKSTTLGDNLAKILIGVGGALILGAGIWAGIMIKTKKV